MKLRTGRFALVALAVSTLVSFMAATPSGATVYDYHVKMVEGSINVDDTMFPTPGVGIEECPGNTSIQGTINSTTNTVTAALNIASPFVSPLDDEDYILEASGTANTHGTFDPGDHTFEGLHFSTINFALFEFDTEECTTGSQICMGDATLTVDGGLIDTTLPLDEGDHMYVNGSGTITSISFSTCQSIFYFLLNNAELTITPNTDLPPADGATFEQIT